MIVALIHQNNENLSYMKMNDFNEFILTKEYKRFEEFCNACKQYRYIGLCHGNPGVGKTLSGLHYSQWDGISKLYESYLKNVLRESEAFSVPDEVIGYDTTFMTASATSTPLRLEKSLMSTVYQLCSLKYFAEKKEFNHSGADFTKICLVIIDEADRLKYSALEQLRDMYDQHHFGLVLIGMPGIERRLSRYPQLYSRIGFVHEFRPLSADETTFIIERHLDKLSTQIDSNHFSDYESLLAIARTTRGNFRILNRLFQQIERLMQINKVDSISADLINAARECLVIGKS